MAMHDNSLGKTMAKVFAKTQRKDGSQSTGYLDIDINLLMPSRHNPRTHFDPEHIEELARSIQKHGILQPIVVLRRGGGYEIISGERRYRAAQTVGLSTVPVVIHDDVNEEELSALRLIENIQREDLNAIELAIGYQNLIKEHGLTQEQIAEHVGKDRSSIANSLRLLTLPKPIQAMVADNSLSAGHARALIPMTDQDRQRGLAHRIINDGLSVRETERLIRSALATGSTKPDSPARNDTPAHIKELEGNLYRLFGAPVQIRERAGKGSLTIRFASKGAFKHIVDILDAAFRQSREAPPPSSDS